MEGWLQWEGRVLPVIPVKIANFSAGGVAIWVDPKLDLCPGGHGVLITQAHGRGCGYRPVKGCWQVKIEGDKVTWVKDGKDDGKGTIVPGNPNNF